MTNRTTTIDLVKEQDFLIESSERDIVITGTDFVLPLNSAMFESKNLTIRANYLKIVQDICLPGKNLSIFCRKLDVTSKLIFDVSGSNATPILYPAENGQMPGSSGKNGVNGKNGENAGFIEIYLEQFTGEQLFLKANGGNGSNGQDGGNGAPGSTGSDAPDRNSPNSRGSYQGYSGGKGGTGGGAGKGGNGGNGGNAGNITFECIMPFNMAEITTQNFPGKPGEPGRNGIPGTGGAGGNGGLGWYCEWDEPRY